ncbi:phosphotransferase enzyme family protein [Lysinibacillus sphaericus]
MNLMKFTSEGRTFYLKERKGTSSWERTEEYRITQFLIVNGVNVETPILNNRGEPYVKEGGSYYSLYASLEGEPLQVSIEGCCGQFIRLGEYLAGFHLALGKCPFEQSTQVWDLFNYFKSWISESNSELTEWAGKVYEEISSYEVTYKRLPLQLVHSDAHLRNVLWKGDEILGLVDFERIRQSPRIGDLAYIIASLLRYSGSIIDLHHFFRNIRELMRGYTLNLGISEEEASLLPHLVILILLQYTMYYSQQGYVKAAVFHKESIDYLMGDKDYVEALTGH